AALDEAATAAEALGARLLLARVGLYAASARLRAGDAAAARQALDGALNAAQAFPFLRREDPLLWSQLTPLEGPAAAPAAGHLTLAFLGGFGVELDGVPLTRWPRKKARAVLAALALHPRGLDAVALAEVLDEEPAPTTVKALQIEISSLRRILEPDLAAGRPSRYVVQEGSRYTLVWDKVALFDVRAFEAAAVLARTAMRGEPAGALGPVTAALALYGGELLDEDKLRARFEPERQGLRRAALDLAVWLGAHHPDPRAAEAGLRRAVAIAPADEEVYRELAAFHIRQGEPERARQVYWDCRKALKLHLGTSPSAEFAAGMV
ncbi:MAG: transcriptional activator domain protein, partial [Cyanobacteria bacterium RYN_339]|nr:transcriptional activator domain protein [Cyanobacteria bacterium RYN_339]